MARNVTIVEPSFECLSDMMLRGSILCLDEFDATREAILDSLIDKAFALQADYLQLFIQVYKGVQMHEVNRDLKALRDQLDKKRTLTWNDLLAQAEEIYQDGALQYSMKTVDVEEGKGRNFLFHDISYLTVLEGKRTHIRAVRNDDQAQVQIHFDTPEKYSAHKDEPRLVLQNFLRRIHVFLLRFQRYVYSWADEYARQVNAGKGPAEDLYPVAAAAETIFREYGLNVEDVYKRQGPIFGPNIRSTSRGRCATSPLSTPSCWTAVLMPSGRRSSSAQRRRTPNRRNFWRS